MRKPVHVAVLLTALIALVLPSVAQASRALYLANGDNTGLMGQAQVFPIGGDDTPSASTQTVTTAAAGYFNGVSMSPDGRIVFMADYTGKRFLSFTVAADGKLTPAPGSPKSLAPTSGPYGSAVTPDGKFVIVSDYDRHGLEVLALGADGSLTQVPGGFLELNPTAQPYMPAVSTDSRTVYSTDQQSDQVYALRIATDGSLSAAPNSPYSAGDEPYEAAVTPDGKYLYVPNYGSNDVSAYAIAADGSLTPVTGSPFAVATDPYGGIAITPDSRTLYMSGSGNRIDIATIAADGSLSTATGSPVVVGQYNPGLALSPDGKLLYNAVDDTFKLNSFSVGAGGALTPVGNAEDLPADSGLDIQSLVGTPNQPPTAAVTAKPGTKTKQVSFDASGSTDADGTVASYTWDFGDGQTETTTTPKVTHKYSKAKDYAATVTLTDNEGCSTTVIFTGQTALCNGSTVAMAKTTADSGIAGAKVKAKDTQKQKGSLKIVVKAGAKEKVKVVASGSASFKGVKDKIALKKAKGSAKAGKTKTLKLKAKMKDQGSAVVGSKGKAKIKVKLTDKAGNVVTKSVKVKLK